MENMLRQTLRGRWSRRTTVLVMMVFGWWSWKWSWTLDTMIQGHEMHATLFDTQAQPQGNEQENNESKSVPIPMNNDTMPRTDSFQECPLPPKPLPRVLFISMAIRGHATPLLRLAEEMVRRHTFNVSFATHNSGKEWVIPTGARFVSAGDFPLEAHELRDKLKAITKDPSIFRGILTIFNDIYIEASRPLYDALFPLLQHDPPDLVIYDIGTLGAQDLVHRLQIPYIINSPTLLFDLAGRPSNVPAWGSGFSMDMSLWNRCMNLMFPRLLSVALTPPLMYLNQLRLSLNLPPYRSQHEIFRGARIILNAAFGFEYARPLSPLIDAVGPILPLADQVVYMEEHRHQGETEEKGNKEGKGKGKGKKKGLHGFQKPFRSQLSPTITQWFAGDHLNMNQLHGRKIDGVIYVHLGSMPYVEAWQAEAITQGLSIFDADHAGLEKSDLDSKDGVLSLQGDHLYFRVLWTLSSDHRSALPRQLPPSFRVYTLSNDVPHLQILAHPAVKLVISHCGVAAAQEALYYGKPVLCLPFFADQPDVAIRIFDAGVGLSLNKSFFTKEEVSHKVWRLCNDTQFRDHAERMGKVLRRSGGLERALSIVESGLLIGFDHLKTIDVSSPWHKVILLDVYALYASILCVLLVLTQFFITLLHRAWDWAWAQFYSICLLPTKTFSSSAQQPTTQTKSLTLTHNSKSVPFHPPSTHQ